MHFLGKVPFFLLLAMAMNSARQTNAQNDSVISVPSISPEDLPRASHSIYASPPSLPLIPHSPQARPGSIWVRSTDDGLHMYGKCPAANSFTLSGKNEPLPGRSAMTDICCASAYLDWFRIQLWDATSAQEIGA